MTWFRTALRWGALLCIVMGMSLSQRLEAQTVHGRVFDAQGDRSLTEALVTLVDAQGEARTATTTNESGRYELAVPEPGVYHLRAVRVGYETYESEPLDVQTGSAELSLDLPMRPSPIPIRGVEVTTDQVNRRLRAFLGMNPALLRVRPVRSATISEHMRRGNGLSEMIGSLPIPNLQVLRTREGPCFQFRGRGCLPVYLDGARLNRAPNSMLPLEMLSTVVVLLPNEIVAYPAGAVHLYTIGYMR